MVFLLFSVAIEGNFDKNLDGIDDLFRLFVRKLGEHGYSFHFVDCDVVLACYIFLFNVFHEVWCIGMVREWPMNLKIILQLFDIQAIILYVCSVTEGVIP